METPMGDKGIERRLCQRFNIPGATVSYRRHKLLGREKDFDEEFCPMLDISRGGVRFLNQRPLKFKSRILLQISIPGERIPLTMVGKVRWSSFNPGKSYRFQAGAQFNAYGEDKGQNYPGNLTKIMALEQKFIDVERPESPGKTSEFSI
jgi:hypothetical protein